ncbi:MAG: diguanylate cyclase with sensor [Desulfomicrobiaceae bacterium]|nr:diguanylate cyclase with sensor [Desulfomicrobiaceae bacterium]
MRAQLSRALRESLRASFSPVAAKLLAIIVDPTADAKAVADTLRADPALAGTVLALVNSPAYGQTQRIADLHRAVVVLGRQELLRIALAVSLHRSLGVVLLEHGFDPNLAWRTIVWGALAAEAMAQHAHPSLVQEAYLATLLKDLAVLILTVAGRLPKGAPADLVGPGLPEAIEHHALTAELLEFWNLPRPVIEAVQHHHDLAGVLEHPPLTQLVILATAWAEAEFRTQPAPEALGQVHLLIKRAVGLDAAGLETLRATVGERFDAMCTVMRVNWQTTWSFKPYAVDDIQDFLAQAREIEAVTGDVSAVATVMGRHVRWNWGCRNAEVVLRDPEAPGWVRFALTPTGATPLGRGNLLATMPLPASLSPILMTDHDEPLGELRLSQADCGEKSATELYARLAAASYRRYLTYQAPQRAKAALLESLPVGVALLGANGRLIAANKALGRYLTTAAPKEALLTELLALLPHSVQTEEWRQFLEDPQQDCHCTAFCPLDPQMAETVPCISVSAYRMASRENASRRILLLIQDLSAVHFHGFEAVEQRDFLAGLLRVMPDIVMTIDEAGVIGFVSKPYAQALVGRNILDLGTSMNPLDPHWDLSALLDRREPVEVRTTLSNREFVLELLGIRVQSPRYHAVLVGRDMTAVRRLERAIKDQALLDALTRVFNRHHLTSITEREMDRSQRTGKPLGVLFFDVDRFKQYNDRHGHSAGDELLAGIGAVLRENLRKGMDYPFRFGGDEFLVLCANASPEGLSLLASRIQKQTAALTQECTLSIGATLLAENDSVQSLISRADAANYQAKQGGGNTFVFLAPPESPRSPA